MKKTFLAFLPLAIVLSGCTAPAEDAASQPSPSTPESPSAQNGGETPAKPAAAGATAADPQYRVVDDVHPRMPAEVIAALQKARVPPPQNMTVPAQARVRVETTKGAITVELNEKAAPLHVKSFLYLVNRGFYNGTVFHRYDPGFVIQGGDPLSKDPKLGEPFSQITGSPSGFHGAGGPGYNVPRERNTLKHGQFVLAAARSPHPDSAGSQFYFTLEPASHLDEGDGYTVFGRVVDGQENVLKLRAGDKLTKATLLPVAGQKPTP